MNAKLTSLSVTLISQPLSFSSWVPSWRESTTKCISLMFSFLLFVIQNGRSNYRCRWIQGLSSDVRSRTGIWAPTLNSSLPPPLLCFPLWVSLLSLLTPSWPLTASVVSSQWSEFKEAVLSFPECTLNHPRRLVCPVSVMLYPLNSLGLGYLLVCLGDSDCW